MNKVLTDSPEVELETLKREDFSRPGNLRHVPRVEVKRETIVPVEKPKNV